MIESTVKLTFQEPVLGSWPANPELVEGHITPRAPEDANVQGEAELVNVFSEEELMEEALQRSTIFPQVDGRRVFMGYAFKGFCKESCYAMRQVPGSPEKKLTSYKKKIDLLIFTDPLRIPYDLPEGADILWNERPLRAQTPKGERICLARSEMIPAGTSITFTIRCLDPSLMDFVHGWLDYGALHGLGQWRNASYGVFTWEELS